MLSAVILSKRSYPAMLFWNNWYTRGLPPAVLSYWQENPSKTERLHRIETDLFHNGLNPAHVGF